MKKTAAEERIFLAPAAVFVFESPYGGQEPGAPFL